MTQLQTKEKQTCLGTSPLLLYPSPLTADYPAQSPKQWAVDHDSSYTGKLHRRELITLSISSVLPRLRKVEVEVRGQWPTPFWCNQNRSPILTGCRKGTVFVLKNSHPSARSHSLTDHIVPYPVPEVKSSEHWQRECRDFTSSSSPRHPPQKLPPQLFLAL